MRDMTRLILEATSPEDAEKAGGALLSGPYEDSAAAREAAEEKHQDKDITFAADDDDKWYIYMKEGKSKKLQHALDIVDGVHKSTSRRRIKEGEGGWLGYTSKPIQESKYEVQLTDLEHELDKWEAVANKSDKEAVAKRKELKKAIADLKKKIGLKEAGAKDSLTTTKSREEIIEGIESIIEYFRYAHESDVEDVLSDLQDLIRGFKDTKSSQKDRDLEVRAQRARGSMADISKTRVSKSSSYGAMTSLDQVNDRGYGAMTEAAMPDEEIDRLLRKLQNNERLTPEELVTVERDLLPELPFKERMFTKLALKVMKKAYKY